MEGPQGILAADTVVHVDLVWILLYGGTPEY